jgi:hypothetical protein
VAGTAGLPRTLLTTQGIPAPPSGTRAAPTRGHRYPPRSRRLPRRQIGNGADGAVLSQPRPADEPDDAEVGEEDRAVRTAQDVAGLDVPVHHSERVDVSQCVGDRPADPGGLGWRKSRASGALRQRQSCITTNETPASVPASKTATMLGCCSRANARISSCCRTWLVAISVSPRKTLTATRRPSRQSFAS